MKAERFIVKPALITKIKCSYCDKEYSNKGIHTHIMRTHLNTGFEGSSGKNNSYSKKEFKEKISKSRNISVENKLGKLKQFHVNCYKCKADFLVEEREHKFPSREKYFCSKSCANSRDMTHTRVKIKNTLQKINNTPKQLHSCQVCGNTVKSAKRKHCSVSCANKTKYKHIDKTTLAYYRKQCKFNFSLNDYPDEFDFRLIEQFGWYKAKNRGNNLSGISRDHIISVRYGFDNKIDPKIISHPANCQLMQHGKNVSKGTKCNLTIEELFDRINIWNDKYKR